MDKFVILLLACLICWGEDVLGQTDTLSIGVDTLEIPADTISIIPADTISIILEDSVPPWRFNPEINGLVVADTVLPTPIETDKPTKEKIPLVQAIKAQLPEIYEVEVEKKKKLKLRIKIPWREDDLIIPFPKGLMPAGTRPPFDPDVAFQRSLVIPGWGQAYNKSYWKIPFFYAGYGGFLWWLNLNQGQYNKYRQAYIWEVDEDPTTFDPDLVGSVDQDGMRSRREAFRQRRDNAIILLMGWHLLHVVEAYVNAHLKGFDVSEDLSLKVRPDLFQLSNGFGNAPYSPGINLSISF